MDEREGPLDGDDLIAWRSFLRWSERTRAAVESEMLAAAGLSGADFQIMAQLDETPGRVIGQKELGEVLAWSASRLSHQLARMETRGHIIRRSSGAGRALEIELTEEGIAAYVAVQPTQAAAVRREFLEILDGPTRSFLLRWRSDLSRP